MEDHIDKNKNPDRRINDAENQNRKSSMIEKSTESVTDDSSRIDEWEFEISKIKNLRSKSRRCQFDRPPWKIFDLENLKILKNQIELKVDDFEKYEIHENLQPEKSRRSKIQKSVDFVTNDFVKIRELIDG